MAADVRRAPSTASSASRATPVLVGLGALLWVAQGFLSPVSTGTYSSSTTLDLARIALAGSAGGLLPPVVAVALLVVPGAAVALLAMAVWTHVAVRRARVAVTALGLLALVVQVLLVLDGEWSRVGPGTLCALAGGVLALAGVTSDGPARGRATRSEGASRPSSARPGGTAPSAAAAATTAGAVPARDREALVAHVSRGDDALLFDDHRSAPVGRAADGGEA